MPAKKPKKKKPKKSGKKNVEQSIRKAVDSIPDMIANDLRNTQTDTQVPKTTKKTLHKSAAYHKDQGKRKKIVWFGVGATALLVFGMWFINAYFVVYDTTNTETKSEERALIESAGNSLRDIFETTKADLAVLNTDSSTSSEQTVSSTKETKTPDEKTLKESLSAILEKITNTNTVTTTTSTPETVSSTTLAN